MNGCTELEKTFYYYNITADQLIKSLEIFGQKFIADDQICEQYFSNEILSIEAEFQQQVQNERSRFQQLMASWAKQGHPITKFSWGSAETLSMIPQRDGINTFKAAFDFKKKFYSSNNMTMTIYTTSDPYLVENCIKNVFANVPNTYIQQKRDDIGHQSSPFNTEKFTRLYKMVPIESLKQVEITWPLPSLLKNYRANPMKYFQSIFGYCGRGSIFSALKKRNFAEKIICGDSESALEIDNTSASSLFRIIIDLTDLGMQNINEVVSIIYLFINMLKEEGPKEYIWRDQFDIGMNDFIFAEKANLEEVCHNICSNLMDRDIEDVIISDYVTLEFDIDLIMSCIEMLTPVNMNIVVRSKNYQEVCLETERWFGTKYCSEDISEDCLQSWQNPPLMEEGMFHLPPNNRFVADNFKLQPHHPKFRKISKANPFVKYDCCVVWFQSNFEWRIPKGHVNFLFRPYKMNTTATESSLLDLFISCLNFELCEETCSADAAQLKSELKALENGFVVKFNGFNQKLKVLIMIYLEKMLNISKEIDGPKFEVIKKILLDQYQNIILCPINLSHQLLETYLTMHSHTASEKLQALDITSVNVFQKFLKEMFDGLYIECLALGNFSAWDVKEIIDEVQGKFQIKPDNKLITTVCSVQKGTTIILARNKNTNDKRSITLNYYNCSNIALKCKLMLEILLNLIKGPLFDELRTNEALGYLIKSELKNIHGTIGCAITICSTTFSSDFLDDRIDVFIDSFNKKIFKLSNEEFCSAVSQLKAEREGSDADQEDQTERYFKEIISREWMFDRDEQELNELKNIKLDELKDFMEEFMPGDRHERRKISIQIIGNKME